jgi:hypothetical protein
MATKVSAIVPNRAGESVKVYGQLEDDTVFVWIANGPQVGGFKLSRFGGSLTSETLYNVLTGKN